MNKLTAFLKKNKTLLLLFGLIILILIIIFVINQISFQKSFDDYINLTSSSQETELSALEIAMQSFDANAIPSVAINTVDFFDQTLSVDNVFASNLECDASKNFPDQLTLATTCTAYDQNPIKGLAMLWGKNEVGKAYARDTDLEFLEEDVASYYGLLSGTASATLNLQNTNNYICAYLSDIWQNENLNITTATQARELCFASSQVDPLANLDEEALTAVLPLLNDKDTIITQATDLLFAHDYDNLRAIDEYLNEPLETYAMRTTENAIRASLAPSDTNAQQAASDNLSVLLAKAVVNRLERLHTSQENCALVLALGTYRDYLGGEEESYLDELYHRYSQNTWQLTEEINPGNLETLAFCSFVSTKYGNYNPNLMQQKIMSYYYGQKDAFGLNIDPYPFLSAVPGGGNIWLINTELNGQILGGLVKR